ncbi:hypothetical protein BC6307_13540 [Sutcliffiella cohnii]|uniref:DUF2487 domain-containing protein n=1 Tax=Sutcliffiella cohnii TaxID=33932 RepID=A0A223KS90_9BACI|nr:YpiF family protein [Sutcliffiella cohnii]AST92237.1 hypothetical protein BC6307_13540 [Sutcliffiella cohnii]
MKWTTKDVTVYEQSKEYIDTAIIPLVPISFKADMKNLASLGEYITTLTNELERQFKGRVMLLPTYTYLFHGNGRIKKEVLNEYIQHLEAEGVKHIFLLTSDQQWKQEEEEINGKLLWLPAIPLEDMEEKYKQKLITDQMNQLLPIFISKWH